MDDNQFLQAGLPAVKGGLDVSSARLLALPALLASAVEAKKPLAKFLFWSMWMKSMMVRLNDSLNMGKLKWLRKTKSKKMDRAKF